MDQAIRFQHADSPGGGPPPHPPSSPGSPPPKPQAPHGGSRESKPFSRKPDTGFEETPVPSPLKEMGLGDDQETTAQPIPEAPAASGKDKSVWDWTAQYGKKEGSKEGQDDSRGFEIGDPILSPEEAKMAAMYVPAERVSKAHNPDLTFTPRILEKPFPWRWFFLGIVVVLAAVVVMMATIQMDTGTDVRGRVIRRTPIQAIWLKISGFKEATADPEITAYLRTKDLIQEVYASAIEHERRTGSFPTSVAKLVEDGLLSEDSTYDGWGNPFAIIAVAHKIVSGGADEKLDTTDDITLDAKGLRAPGHYQAYELQKGLQGY